MVRTGGPGGGASKSSGSSDFLCPEEVEALEEEIQLVDKAIARAKERKDLQHLLEFHEKSLFLRKKLYPGNSTEVHDAICALVEACNYVATSMLQVNNTQVVFDLLKRALDVNHLANLQKAITYNNLACYYRRIGKLRTALIYLEKAYQLESLFPNSDVSQTHLNLCATLSQLGKHEKALYHAQTAIIKVYQLLCPLLLSFSAAANNEQGDEHPDDGGQGQNSTSMTSQSSGQNSRQQVLERVSVLCIAYFNKGVEHEHLKDITEAVATYTEGLKWARQWLGDGHQIAKILEHSLSALGKSPGPPGGQYDGAPMDPHLQQLMTPRQPSSNMNSKSATSSGFHPKKKSNEPVCISTHKNFYQPKEGGMKGSGPGRPQNKPSSGSLSQYTAEQAPGDGAQYIQTRNEEGTHEKAFLQSQMSSSSSGGFSSQHPQADQAGGGQFRDYNTRLLTQQQQQQQQQPVPRGLSPQKGNQSDAPEIDEYEEEAFEDESP